MQPDTVAVTAVDNPLTSNWSWIKVAERFGLPVVVLLLVLWWAKSDVVQPLLNAHFNVIDRIVEGQKETSEEVREVGKKLDRLIEITSAK